MKVTQAVILLGSLNLRAEEAENIPISLDAKNVNGKEGDILSQIRTCPPSPQCFSVGRAPRKATPLKASRSRPPERRILGELDRCNTELPKEEAVDDKNVGEPPQLLLKDKILEYRVLPMNYKAYGVLPVGVKENFQSMVCFVGAVFASVFPIYRLISV